MAQKEEKWTPTTAEGFLSRQGIKSSNKIIEIKDKCGLKVLSAADYLSNFHNYIIKFIKKSNG